MESYQKLKKIKTMKIIIAAGTGFLGKNLEQYFTEKGNKVYILTRNPKRKMKSIGTQKIWANGKIFLKTQMF